MKQNLLSRICGHALPCLLVAFLVPVSVRALQGEITGGQQAATAQEEGVDVLAASFERVNSKFFTADHVVFRYDDDYLQLELFVSIDRGILATKPLDEGVQARYQVSFRVFDGENQLGGDSWVRSDFSADPSARRVGQKIPELVKYPILPGKYRLEFEVADLVTEEYQLESYPVELKAFQAGELAVSDIIFASRVEKVQGPAGEFDHSGLLVLPNAERLYGIANPRAFYYAEIYNLTGGQGNRYRVDRRILDQEGRVVKTLAERERDVPGASCVDVDAFSIATLQTGTYTLEIEVTDLASGKQTTVERAFWIFRPGEEPRATVHAGLVDPGFDVAAMSESEIDLELEMIMLIVPPRVKNQIKSLEAASKRVFLASFWVSNDPDSTTRVNEFREAFLQRAKEANQQYGTFRKQGWKTDRGRVYLMLGAPSNIEDHPYEEDTSRSYQIWEYDYIEGGVIFVFVDRTGFGDFTQVHSNKLGEPNNPSWIELELRR